MPEFIDPVFAKTSPKRSFSISKNDRFVLVFAKTGSIKSGTKKQPRKFKEILIEKTTFQRSVLLLQIETIWEEVIGDQTIEQGMRMFLM